MKDDPIVLFRSHYRSDRYYYTVALAQAPSRERDERAPGKNRSSSLAGKRSNKRPQAKAGNAKLNGRKPMHHRRPRAASG